MNCGRQLDAVTRPDLWVEKFFSKNSRIFGSDLVASASASDASFDPVRPHVDL